MGLTMTRTNLNETPEDEHEEPKGDRNHEEKAIYKVWLSMIIKTHIGNIPGQNCCIRQQESKP